MKQSAGSGVERIKLVVLPFRDLGREADQEYFSDGMTDELISRLAGFNPDQFGVISRPSAMCYKGVDKSLEEIGAELGVDYVLEGSVRRSGDRLRITAQLSQVAGRIQLWAQRYDRLSRDVLKIQEEVAGCIAQSLSLELTSGRDVAGAKLTDIPIESYEEYLKGCYQWNKRSETGFRASIEHFLHVIRDHPSYAPAHAALADSYLLMGVHRVLAAREAFPRAKASALTAIQLGEAPGQVHATLGLVFLYYDHDWPAARNHFRQAIELQPGSATIYHWHAIFLSVTGEHGAALEAIARAVELDPLSLVINAAVGWLHCFAGNYDRAIAQSQHTFRMEPTFAMARTAMILAYLETGRQRDAIEVLESIITAPGGRVPLNLAGLAHAYGVSGREDDARRLLEELKAMTGERHVSSYDMAIAHLGLPDRRPVFEFLERAFEERDHALVYLDVDPRFAPLRGSPEMTRILERMSLPGV